MCCVSLCFMLCFRHTSCAATLSEGTIKELSSLCRDIQPRFTILKGWSPSITYNDKIKNKITKKIRNALKENNIKVLVMNMSHENFYETQIAYFMYKKLMNYYNNDIIEFEIIPTEFKAFTYDVPEEIKNIYDINRNSFRTNFLKVNNNYSISIDTENIAEIRVLHEKFEEILLNIIEKMDMNLIVKTISEEYDNIQYTIQTEEDRLKTMININVEG